jgi:hypothetical protein
LSRRGKEFATRSLVHRESSGVSIRGMTAMGSSRTRIALKEQETENDPLSGRSRSFPGIEKVYWKKIAPLVLYHLEC